MSQSQDRTALIVLGMHCSGASALAEVLGHLGAALPKGPIGLTEMNAGGFFEADRITDLNERLLQQAERSWWDPRPVPLTWFSSSEAAALLDEAVATLEADYGNASLFVMKDPRICRLLPFWRTALGRFGAQALVVHMHSRALDVAASLTHWADHETDYGLVLWALHVLDAEKGSRDMRRSFTCYEALIDDWRSVAQGLARDLDITWPQETDQEKAAIDHFLSGDLQHLKAASAEDRTEPPLPPVVAELQDMLGSWVGGADPARDSDRLDQFRMALEISVPLFHPLAIRTIDLVGEINSMTGCIQAMQTEYAQLAEQLREAQANLADAAQEHKRCEEESVDLLQRLASMDRRLHVALIQLRHLTKQREREIKERLRLAIALDDPAAMADRLDVLTNRVERMKEEVSTAIAARDQARKEAQEALEWGRRREAELLGSTSWRVTSPLRALSRASLRLRP
ncbi:sulfotransferase family protein [Paracoccus aerius]|uniref:sulfotransferase family protein n=1 Tax=Paracoccus aerius TaxID=1915382 RepID=UPI00174D3E5B|nr:hypothetical protein [Paracoccus aerius]GHG11692.1 sulfotransferase family protein [Paracoccus aerius]